MKIQCSCGAKYAFDVTPDMARNPVKFICPSCGQDASDFVNQLIQKETEGMQTLPSAAEMEPPVPAPPPPPPPGKLRVAHDPAPAAPPPQAAPVSKFCSKHRERGTAQCFVCHKPICPKCLELFGYFCSPLCKGKAEAEHLNVPVYAGRKDVVEARFWRRTELVAGFLGLLAVLGLAAWVWYAWFGSVPHPYFSVRFEDNNRGYYGHAQLVGKDQLVFLHGGTLARYDLTSQKPVWTDELISKQQMDDAIRAANEGDARANEGEGMTHRRSGDDIQRGAVQELQAQLDWHVSGQNIWVENDGILSRYDWDTGKVARQFRLPALGGELVQSGDELQVIGQQSVTHINVATGEARVEQFGSKDAKPMVLAQADAGTGIIDLDPNRPLDPQKAEAQVQNLTLPGQIALPALLSNARHEKELEKALQDTPDRLRRPAAPPPSPGTDVYQLVAGPTGFVQFEWRLLEQRVVTRSAMKAPSGKSALNGDANAAHSGEIANEILNDMQRNSGGDTVSEDESRYQVTVHIPDANATPDWTGEVTGPPQLFVLKTVNVIAAGKDVVVLDKANKKLWQTTLTYAVTTGAGDSPAREQPYGEGPCVEHDGALYVFDQAVLTAFDAATGNARWRLPSVGVLGLFFDDQDNVYVNTTTGNPDDLKYSRQIDITRQIESVVSKVDAKAGTILWTIKPDGYVSYVSGKFVYAVSCYDPNPGDADVLNDMTASLQKRAFLHITRINPANGRTMWDYYDRERCPVNWSFDGSSIQLIFKREVQVLRYLTF
jgi:hypothetical protein